MTRLEGWKQIAPFFEVTERTAQTWAKTGSMPIRRSSPDRGRVYADPQELENWLMARWRDKDRSVRKAITVRLPSKEYDRLKRLRTSRPEFKTMQELAERALKEFLESVGSSSPNPVVPDALEKWFMVRWLDRKAITVRLTTEEYDKLKRLRASRPEFRTMQDLAERALEEFPERVG